MWFKFNRRRGLHQLANAERSTMSAEGRRRSTAESSTTNAERKKQDQLANAERSTMNAEHSTMKAECRRKSTGEHS